MASGEQYFPRRPNAVRIEVCCDATQPGDHVLVVGEPHELGNWNPHQALALLTCAEIFPQWVVDVGCLPTGAEFKFIIARSNGTFWWEPMHRNRCWPEMAQNGAKISASFGEPDLYVAERVVLASPERRPRFKPTVSCFHVPNLRDLDPPSKSVLWWQQEDFAEFLRIRVEIARAYMEAKRTQRISARGSFDMAPELRQESRRGLGLERMEERKHVHRAYMDAVLGEQSRQRCQASAPAARISAALDGKRLAEAARAASEGDVVQAIARAEQDHLRVLQDSGEGRGPAAVLEEEKVRGHHVEPIPDPSLLEGVELPGAEGDSTVSSGMKRVPSYPLCCGTSVGGEPIGAQVQSPLAASKGFGLSREELEEAGVQANGNLVRRQGGEDGEEEDEGSGALSDGGSPFGDGSPFGGSP